jgi:hypothetical protein
MVVLIKLTKLFKSVFQIYMVKLYLPNNINYQIKLV